MTPERRNEILSKETITTAELAELLEVNRTYASTCMVNIKLKSDRLAKITGETIKGRCHVQDYLDYFGLDANAGRYGKFNDKVVDVRVTNPDDFKKHWNVNGSVCAYREET